MQSPIPEARLLPLQFHQLAAQRLVRALRPIAIRRHRHRHHPARPPLAEGILLPHLPAGRLSSASSTRFFQSPTATRLCPGSDPPPASSAARSPPATVSPPAPGSRPCRRTSPSRRRSCVWTPPLPAPHPPPCAPLPVV